MLNAFDNIDRNQSTTFSWFISPTEKHDRYFISELYSCHSTSKALYYFTHWTSLMKQLKPYRPKYETFTITTAPALPIRIQPISHQNDKKKEWYQLTITRKVLRRMCIYLRTTSTALTPFHTSGPDTHRWYHSGDGVAADTRWIFSIPMDRYPSLPLGLIVKPGVRNYTKC